MSVEELFRALEQEKQEDVEAILMNGDQIDRNCVNSKNLTPILIAAKKGLVEALKILVKNKFDIEAKTPNEDEFSALHLAVSNGHIPAIRILLEAGIGINVEGSNSSYPIEVALLDFPVKEEGEEELDLEGEEEILHLQAVEATRLEMIELLASEGALEDSLENGLLDRAQEENDNLNEQDVKNALNRGEETFLQRIKNEKAKKSAILSNICPKLLGSTTISMSDSITGKGNIVDLNSDVSGVIGSFLADSQGMESTLDFIKNFGSVELRNHLSGILREKRNEIEIDINAGSFKEVTGEFISNLIDFFDQKITYLGIINEQNSQRSTESSQKLLAEFMASFADDFSESVQNTNYQSDDHSSQYDVASDEEEEEEVETQTTTPSASPELEGVTTDKKRKLDKLYDGRV